MLVVNYMYNYWHNRSTIATHFGGLLACDQSGTLATYVKVNVDHISSHQATTKRHGEDPPT